MKKNYIIYFFDFINRIKIRVFFINFINAKVIVIIFKVKEIRILLRSGKSLVQII